MKLKQLFGRRILCYLLLVIPVLLLSVLVSKNISIMELYITNRLLATLYIFTIKDILMRLAPSVFAIAYAFVLFGVVKDHPKRQLIMILNTFSMMALSIIAGIAVYAFTSWFDGIVIITFTQTMVIIGLITIVLTPIFAVFQPDQKNCVSG